MASKGSSSPLPDITDEFMNEILADNDVVFPDINIEWNEDLDKELMKDFEKNDMDLIKFMEDTMDKQTPLDPVDEKLLEEDIHTPHDSLRSRQHSPSVSWLRKSEYISTEQTRFQPQNLENIEAKVGYNVKKSLREETLYLDHDAQIKAIEKTFEDAKVVKHRPLDATEYRMQRYREKQLEAPGDEDEEEEVEEEEMEDTAENYETQTTEKQTEKNDESEHENENEKKNGASNSDDGDGDGDDDSDEDDVQVARERRQRSSRVRSRRQVKSSSRSRSGSSAHSEYSAPSSGSAHSARCGSAPSGTSHSYYLRLRPVIINRDGDDDSDEDDVQVARERRKRASRVRSRRQIKSSSRSRSGSSAHSEYSARSAGSAHSAHSGTSRSYYLRSRPMPINRD